MMSECRHGETLARQSCHDCVISRHIGVAEVHQVRDFCKWDISEFRILVEPPHIPTILDEPGRESTEPTCEVCDFQSHRRVLETPSERSERGHVISRYTTQSKDADNPSTTPYQDS